jgi:hypothetical protein
MLKERAEHGTFIVTRGGHGRWPLANRTMNVAMLDRRPGSMEFDELIG